MPRRTGSLVALLLALAPIAAHSQVIDPVRVKPPGRFKVGVAGIYGQPLGEFGQNVRRGFGLDGHASYGIDPRGIFSLRADIGYLQYGSRSEEFFYPAGYGYLELESSTKSGTLLLGIGPQLSAPAGPIRPYVGGSIGFANFSTSTSLDVPGRYTNSGQNETIDDQTISSDFVLSIAGYGGIALELGMLGRGILIDLGARYHRNGQATYVSPEGIEYTGTGRPTVTATESEADFLVYRIGIVIPIR